MRFAPIFAATLATVVANPHDVEKRQAACGANNIAFRVLNNLGAQGSIFCNGVLNLPTSVIPTTLPTPVITVTSAAVISSVTSLVCPLVPVTKRAAEAEPEAEAEAGLEARQIPGLSGLGGLGLLAGSQITAGCSCLSLNPRTITSRITPPAITSNVPGPTSVVCVTSTLTLT